MRVINALEGTAERGSTVLTARRRVWAWWARKCLTGEGSEVTVRSVSPFGRFVLGFLEDRARQGEQRIQSLVRGGARGPGDGFRYAVEIQQTHGGETRGGRKSTMKVRTER
jgi:hypothetical protein